MGKAGKEIDEDETRLFLRNEQPKMRTLAAPSGEKQVVAKRLQADEVLVNHQYWEREKRRQRQRPVFCTQGVWQMVRGRKDVQCGCCLCAVSSVAAIIGTLLAT